MNPKILVIEDDLGIREEVAALLMYENYTAIVAINGESGIEKALDILPDLIICDINMPGVDGLTVLSELRSYPDTRNIPFIFLTARITKDDVREGMGLGADDCITKPFSNSDLIGAVRTRLQKKQNLTVSTLEQYSRYLIHAQDSRREHTSSQLQNHIIRPLSNLGIFIDSIMPLADSAIDPLLKQISLLVNEVSANANTLQVELWPSALNHVNLFLAIFWITTRYTQQTAIKVVCQHEGMNTSVPEHIQQNLFFIVCRTSK